MASDRSSFTDSKHDTGEGSISWSELHSAQGLLLGIRRDEYEVMMELTEEQDALIRQIVDSFRHGVGGSEGPTWEEHVAAKHGFVPVSTEDGLEWKDDDA